MQYDSIEYFICPNNAQLNCFKMLKFTLKITVSLCTVHDKHTNRTGLICGHTT